MRKTDRLLPLLAVALAACGSDPAPESQPSPTQSANPAALVAAMPAGQRHAVLFRAIRDAGRACQRVEGAEVAPAGTPPGSWLATCDDGARWLVTLTPDGTAIVSGGPSQAVAR